MPAPLRLLRSPAPQRGISLIFALLALAAMSLAAVALLRSVDTSSLIVSNLGLRQDSVTVSAKSSEAAVLWLGQNKTGTVLNTDNPDRGYYATATTALDPTNTNKTNAARVVINWDNDDGCTSYPDAFATCLDAAPVTTENNNRSSYVITRLCTAALPATDSGNSCARGLNPTQSDGGERGSMDYQRYRINTTTEAGPYFRIIVRTTSARNTVSYTETIVHF